MARKFVAAPHLPPRSPAAEPQQYDLKVNHPLTIGGTEVFLIGHGYAPVITIRDGNGEVAYSGPTSSCPRTRSVRSFGVVKAPDAEPAADRARGPVLPDVRARRRATVGLPATRKNPLSRCSAWTGDLGMDDGSPQSVYELDKARRGPR